MRGHIFTVGTVFLLSIVMGFLSFAGFIGLKSFVEHKSVTAEVGQLFLTQPQKFFGKDRINVLLLGIDYNYDDKDQEYSTSARSDTIMAVSLDFPTAANPYPAVHILSVPRDMAYTYPSGRVDKINAAYQEGGSNALRSARASERTVADFLGLPGGFDRFVTLRINATKELIDAIGGIDVVPDETMNYDDSWGHLHIHFKGGKLYHMNGDQAVSYSRFRHDACSDPCRIKRQQQVIRIALNKLEHEKFNDLLHIRQLIDVLNRNVVTDFSKQEEMSIASTFASLDPASVKSEQVPFKSDEDLACCGNVLIADDDAKALLVHKLFVDPVEPPLDQQHVAEIPASDIKVEVENGSGRPGMGAKMAALLRSKGFRIARIGNADSFDYDSTEIHVHSAQQPLAGERVRSLISLPTAKTVSHASDIASSDEASGDVTVIVGRDYAASTVEQAADLK